MIIKDPVKCKLVIPDVIEKKLVLVAYKLISGNAEDRVIDVDPMIFKDPECDSTSLTVDGGFVGFIPKAWLVQIKEDDNS